MGYIADEALAHLRAGGMNLGLFWRLGTDPALHLWVGVNDVPIGIPPVDAAGTVYLGAGRLLNIADVEILINGLADRVEFALSGVSPEFTAQLASDAPSVVGARCTIGMAPFDDRFQPLTDIIPLWSGLADFWTMEQKPTQDPTKPATRSIMLSVGVGDTSRARQRLLSFTNSTQKLVSPTDRFFERVSRYVQTYVLSWPRY